MTTKELGFTTARALAVYFLYAAVKNLANAATPLFQSATTWTDQGRFVDSLSWDVHPSLRPELSTLQWLGMLVPLVLYLLISRQLWLHADKFGGSGQLSVGQTAPDFRQITLLMLSGIGVWLIATSLGPVALRLSIDASPEASAAFGLRSVLSLLVPLVAGVVLVIYPLAVRAGGLLQLFGWPTNEELDSID